DLDRVRLNHADALEKLSARDFKTIIETPYDGRVTLISLPRRIEMEYFAHHFDRTNSLVNVCAVSTLAARTFSSDTERTFLTASAPSALIAPSGENMAM